MLIKWWRRRESNPRPIMTKRRHLQTYFALIQTQMESKQNLHARPFESFISVKQKVNSTNHIPLSGALKSPREREVRTATYLTTLRVVIHLHLLALSCFVSNSTQPATLTSSILSNPFRPRLVRA